VPFNPSMIKKMLKYECTFLGKDEVSTRDFLMREDPYQMTMDERLKNIWIEESKILFGSFYPSGS